MTGGHAGPRPGGDRAAIVTGGTRGIGLGIARALARDGWRLVVSGVRPAADVQAVVDELAALGGAAHYCASDVAVAADRARLVDEAIATFGGIDALVNNAGRAPAVRADILDAGEDSFASLIRTNLQGPYFLTQLIAKHMLERGAGAVMSVAITPGRTSNTGIPAGASRRANSCADIASPALLTQ